MSYLKISTVILTQILFLIITVLTQNLFLITTISIYPQIKLITYFDTKIGNVGTCNACQCHEKIPAPIFVCSGIDGC